MPLLLRCLVTSLISISLLHAQSKTTNRVPQLSNEKVSVWKTVIYPSSKQALTMHRHDHDRVLVALSDGKIKVTNNKGKVHYMTLKKNQAYYLAKDVVGELHNDENLSPHPITVIVVELHN